MSTRKPYLYPFLFGGEQRQDDPTLKLGATSYQVPASIATTSPKGQHSSLPRPPLNLAHLRTHSKHTATGNTTALHEPSLISFAPAMAATPGGQSWVPGCKTRTGHSSLICCDRINVNDPTLIALVNKLQDVFTTVGVRFPSRKPMCTGTYPVPWT